MTMIETSRIPSPEEIERYKSPRGEWSRNVLESWGVEWPPRDGWKEELEKAYHAGQTVGVILECIGCRKAKYFVDYDPYPVCVDCQKWEQERYELSRTQKYFTENLEREIANTPVKEQRKPTFVERIATAFRPRPAYKKEPIPADIRWAVWERDNFTCQHCGSRRNLSVDHIFPESKGGKATLDNCQTLCKPCNSRKGAR